MAWNRCGSSPSCSPPVLISKAILNYVRRIEAFNPQNWNTNALYCPKQYLTYEWRCSIQNKGWTFFPHKAVKTQAGVVLFEPLCDFGLQKGPAIATKYIWLHSSGLDQGSVALPSAHVLLSNLISLPHMSYIDEIHVHVGGENIHQKLWANLHPPPYLRTLPTETAIQIWEDFPKSIFYS